MGCCHCRTCAAGLLCAQNASGHGAEGGREGAATAAASRGTDRRRSRRLRHELCVLSGLFSSPGKAASCSGRVFRRSLSRSGASSILTRWGHPDHVWNAARQRPHAHRARAAWWGRRTACSARRSRTAGAITHCPRGGSLAAAHGAPRRCLTPAACAARRCPPPALELPARSHLHPSPGPILACTHPLCAPPCRPRPHLRARPLCLRPQPQASTVSCAR